MFYYNQNDYESVKYDRPSTAKIETVKSSGCGVVSACMAFNNLAGKELYTVASMAKFSLNHGARDNSGTNLKTLLSALCKEHKEFSYVTTDNENTLVNHLKGGGIAIANQGDAYNIFSTAGHFVVAYQMVGANIEVLDPQMYSGKYDAYSRPQRIVKKTTHGCVVSPTQMGKATADRSPAYFLITYKGTTKKTETKKSPYTIGKTYTLQADIKVRNGAGTNYSQKKRSKLTANAKKNAKIGIYAVLKKGTRVTVQAIKTVGKDVWLQIPSGWIAGYYDGKYLVK